MAWSSKQSATLTIESREEPYLTATLLDKITNEIISQIATSEYDGSRLNPGARDHALHIVRS